MVRIFRINVNLEVIVKVWNIVLKSRKGAEEGKIGVIVNVII